MLTCSYMTPTLWHMDKTKRTVATGLSPKSIKGDTVRMRVSAEQKQALMDAAKRDGLELSAWLRQLGLRAAGFLPEAK
jgi:hypothetical protein